MAPTSGWATQELIKDGTCTISKVIGTRDSIMIYLIQRVWTPTWPLKSWRSPVRETPPSFSPTSTTGHEGSRRSAVVHRQLSERSNTCFPKAHAAAYVIAAIRLGWYKIHYPLEFYATFFTVRGGDFDVSRLWRANTPW